MKVLLINGSPHAHGCTATALNEVAKTLNENGVDTELIQVGHLDVRGCIACGHCYKEGKCVFQDVVNEVAEKFKAMIEGAGTVESIDEWGKRRLAYPINDENDGYYVLYNYECNAEFPKELDRVVGITDGVLRSLIIKK